MIHSQVLKECVYRCCHHRLIVCSIFCFRAVTTFLQLNVIVLKIYKKLVVALALLPGSTNRRVGHSSTELSGDRATSVYRRRRSMILFLNQLPVYDILSGLG